MTTNSKVATYAAIATAAFVTVKAIDLLTPEAEAPKDPVPVTYSDETVSVPGKSITCVFAHSGYKTTVHGCINSDGEKDRIENFKQAKTHPFALGSGSCCSEDSSLKIPQARPALVTEPVTPSEYDGGGGGGGGFSGLDPNDLRRQPTQEERSLVEKAPHSISNQTNWHIMRKANLGKSGYILTVPGWGAHPEPGAGGGGGG